MLQLILGPMFSGKTSELIRRLERASIAGKRVVLLRPKTDTRGHLTHDNKESKIPVHFVDRLYEIEHSEGDVIGVDEAQFFDYPLFATEIDHLAQHCTVIACGLNGTSERTPFGAIQSLIPLCDSIDMLTAICTGCGSEMGTFSYFKAGNKEGDVEVGGKDKYTTLCRACYK